MMTGSIHDHDFDFEVRTFDRFRNFMESRIAERAALAVVYGGLTISSYYLPQVTNAVDGLPSGKLVTVVSTGTSLRGQPETS